MHAALGLGDVRVCFDKSAGSVAEPQRNVIPRTNYPGLAVGRAVRHRKLGSGAAFAVDAAGLAAVEHGKAPFTCEEIWSNALFNKIELPVVPSTEDRPTLLAILGCAPKTGDAKACGPTFDALNGNLRLVPIPLARDATTNAQQLGAQIVNLSPSLDQTIAQKMVSAHLSRVPGCGTSPVIQGSLALAAAIPEAPIVTQAPTAFDTEGFTLCEQGTSLVTSTFAEAQALSDPLAVPSTHFAGAANAAFAIVGDASKSSGPEALHVLALRFEPTR